MRILKARRRRVHTAATGTVLAAALGAVALSGVSFSNAVMGSAASASSPPNTTCPAGASLQQSAQGGSTAAQAQCIITSTGTPVSVIFTSG